ncbi:MAG: mycothiol conjugate amidase Mca [Microthrixaceae bacterium]
MTEPLRLLCVHAHPDDEASKGAGTVAKYAAEGIPATLVCCTGGEAGEILNEAVDTPENRARLGELRLEELAASVAIIGYDRLDLLGYHDSGMPDTPVNERDDNFWNAPLDEATEALVRIIRRDRPQVVVTYGDDQRNYAHPDHLKVHDVSVAAFARAGDPDWYPDAGVPWEPSKLYYSTWSKRRMLALHERFGELGLESPFDAEWLERVEQFSQDDRITTQVDVGAFYGVREAALKAHATQVDPASPFWFGLPGDEVVALHPWDDYILAESRVPTDLPEDDLFAGVAGR